MLFETVEQIAGVLEEMASARMAHLAKNSTGKTVGDMSGHQQLEESEQVLKRLFFDADLGTKATAAQEAGEAFLMLGGLYECVLEPVGDGGIPDFCQFLLTKHQDYGEEPLLISGVRGILDRMLHKLARIKNLRSRPTDESHHIMLEIQDLLGYCVLGCFYTKKHGV